MKTLVTGGCGFVGLCVADELAARGEAVVLLDCANLTGPIRAALLEMGPHVQFASGDITDASSTTSLIAEHKANRIIHLATITPDDAKESNDPDHVIDVNLKGTINVLKAARVCGTERVVYVGSGSAYGSAWYDGQPLVEEQSPSKPETLYGITKFAAEQTALRLGHLWGIEVVAVRLGSVFGPWEYATAARSRMSPYLQLSRMALAGEKALLPASEVVRDWIYSRDVAAGLSAISSMPTRAKKMYHLSSGMEWRFGLRQWCDALKKAYPRFAYEIATGNAVPNIDMVTKRDRAPMCVERLTRDTGFLPRFGPLEASVDYVEWLSTHREMVAPTAEA